MKRRKSLATVVATLALAAGLVVPGTAAARSYSCPTYDPSVAVDVSSSGDVTFGVVSWSD
jgi:hypothetical protein